MSTVQLLAVAVLVFAPIAHELPAPVEAAPSTIRPVIAWHASYDEALRAAAVSHKPVLLFQLLGKLDDALC
ncbi:MAG TPA: hypothetical protein VM509_14260 [Planctomycetota bacterium]|nr:hypothetical protein [Planctomycetota bacterium]